MRSLGASLFRRIQYWPAQNSFDGAEVSYSSLLEPHSKIAVLRAASVNDGVAVGVVLGCSQKRADTLIANDLAWTLTYRDVADTLGLDPAHRMNSK